MEGEIWRDIKNYEGRYQVSNLGRVKSLGNDKSRKEKILKPGKNGWGYLRVCLVKEGSSKMYTVHRLVLSTFNPIDGMDELLVNHKDEDKTNNNLNNLEWCTYSYNNTYNDRHKKIGEKLRGRTLSEETKRKLSENHADFKGENHPMFGKHHSEETKRKQSEAHKGKILSEKTKEKLREANKGENNPWYGKHGKDNPQSIPIVQLTKDGHLVRVWESSMEAEREGGFTSPNITACCKGRLKTHKDYKWQYLHYYISQIDPRIKKVILLGKEYVF